MATWVYTKSWGKLGIRESHSWDEYGTWLVQVTKGSWNMVETGRNCHILPLPHDHVGICIFFFATCTSSGFHRESLQWLCICSSKMWYCTTIFPKKSWETPKRSEFKILNQTSRVSEPQITSTQHQKTQALGLGLAAGHRSSQCLQGAGQDPDLEQPLSCRIQWLGQQDPRNSWFGHQENDENDP
jgi:hypothetical protein